jgi:hypothetical protein
MESGSKGVFKTVGKSVLSIAVVIGGALALLIVGLLFLKGAVWLSDKALPILLVVKDWLLLLCFLVLIPLAMFRSTRVLAANGMIAASIVFGLVLWMLSCVLVYDTFGIFGLVVGLVFMGIGVVPIAIFSTIVHGMWAPLVAIVIMIVATWGFRFLAVYVLSKAEKEQV